MATREKVEKIVKGIKEIRMVPRVPNSANDISPVSLSERIQSALIKQIESLRGQSK